MWMLHSNSKHWSCFRALGMGSLRSQPHGCCFVMEAPSKEQLESHLVARWLVFTSIAPSLNPSRWEQRLGWEQGIFSAVVQLVLGSPPRQCLCVLAHFMWLRVCNKTDRMSQGQELLSHFKRLGMEGEVPWAFKAGLNMGGKDSQHPMDQPVSKSMGQELEKGDN